MNTYYVVYIESEEEQVTTVEADSPGRAFYFAKRKHPGATLVRCYREGMRFGEGRCEWEAPKNQDMPSSRKYGKDHQVTMDDILKESVSYVPFSEH